MLYWGGHRSHSRQSSVECSEALAVRFALKVAREIELKEVIVESDSNSVILGLKNENGERLISQQCCMIIKMLNY